MANIIRGIVSKRKKRFIQDGFDLDLTYVTPRIIAMGYPSTGLQSVYRNPLTEVVRFFEKRHSGHYKIYNLCKEKEEDDGTRAFTNWTRFPFHDFNPCPLKMISQLVESVQAYLDLHPDNVVAIHCKAGKGRTGLMISSYLLYSNVASTADDALERFAAERTHDWKGVTIPSQQRYVRYFEKVLEFNTGLLPSRAYNLNSCEISNLTAQGGSSLLRLDVRLLLRMDKYTWREYKLGSVNADMNTNGIATFTFPTESFKVKGDVKILVYSGRNRLFSFWFHTSFVERSVVSFQKAELDKACKDVKNRKFRSDLAVKLSLNRQDDDTFIQTFVEKKQKEENSDSSYEHSSDSE